jgi:hypothetical protein
MRNLNLFMEANMKISVFANMTLWSMVDHYRRFGETLCLRRHNTRVDAGTRKLEAARFSETSVKANQAR